jgi:hypothetical protein
MAKMILLATVGTLLALGGLVWIFMAHAAASMASRSVDYWSEVGLMAWGLGLPALVISALFFWAAFS